jgi:hypothetical protein
MTGNFGIPSSDSISYAEIRGSVDYGIVAISDATEENCAFGSRYAGKVVGRINAGEGGCRRGVEGGRERPWSSFGKQGEVGVKCVQWGFD